MKRLAVFIATTAGPVQVERITRERAPQSMVCLKRSSTVLPISPGYDSFVRPGSGVIERAFGPFEDGAFRLDVSAPIESGESWQLGIFVAHALVSAGGVLVTEDEADAIVWLTGHVDCDLAIGSVGHVAEKMHASQGALANWLERGRPVTLFVRDGPDCGAALAAGVPEGAKIVSVRTAADVLAALDLRLPQCATLPVVANAVSPRVRRGISAAWLASGFTATTIGAMALARWPLAVPPPVVKAAPVVLAATPQQAAAVAVAPIQAISLKAPATETPAPRAETPSVNMTIAERRAPEGHTCAEVQFGTVAAVEARVLAKTELTTSTIKGLCGLTVTIDNGTQSAYVAVVADVLSGKLLYGTTQPETFTGRQSFTGAKTWSIDLPRRLSEPFEIKLIAISSPRPDAKDAEWLRAQGGNPRALKALNLQGLMTGSLHHRVVAAEISPRVAGKIAP